MFFKKIIILCFSVFQWSAFSAEITDPSVNFQAQFIVNDLKKADQQLKTVSNIVGILGSHTNIEKTGLYEKVRMLTQKLGEKKIPILYGWNM